MGSDTDVNLSALSALLARQKEAIRQGDLLALSTLAGPLAACLDRLARLPAGSGQVSLDRVKQQAEENRRLLGAALQGVQAATGRMRDIAGAANRLTTYDSRGRQSSVSLVPGTVERHA